MQRKSWISTRPSGPGWLPRIGTSRPEGSTKVIEPHSQLRAAIRIADRKTAGADLRSGQSANAPSAALERTISLTTPSPKDPNPTPTCHEAARDARPRLIPLFGPGGRARNDARLSQ